MKKLVGFVALGLITATTAAVSATPITTLPPAVVVQRSTACDLPGLNAVEERDGTVVVLPPGYNKRHSYPAVIMLPYTDSTACRFFSRVFSDLYPQSKTPYIVILPTGSASRADYATGELFADTVERFETDIDDSLTTLVPKYNIDRDRISLAGFSFGADLGWALSVRNPNEFNGAFLIDSLCTYRDNAKMNQVSQGDTHFFLVAGRTEAGESQHPMMDVKGLLDQYKISNVYESFADASHSEIIQAIPAATYQGAVEYIVAD